MGGSKNFTKKGRGDRAILLRRLLRPDVDRISSDPVRDNKRDQQVAEKVAGALDWQVGDCPRNKGPTATTKDGDFPSRRTASATNANRN